jgi:hypothetical protein
MPSPSSCDFPCSDDTGGSGTGYVRRNWNLELEKGLCMLETIAVILVALWLLGFLTSYTMGGLVHALLVLAIVIVAIRVVQGRRAIT